MGVVSYNCNCRFFFFWQSTNKIKQIINNKNPTKLLTEIKHKKQKRNQLTDTCTCVKKLVS